MKIGVILFSGLMTASIGLVLGVAVNEIGAQNLNQYRYKSSFYQQLEKYSLLIGAGLGFAIGAAQESLGQIKEDNKED